MTEIKAVRTEVKSTDDETGVFRAVVSVFGNVDSYGDVMVKGAFAKSLKTWEESGNKIPALWSHKLDDPFAHIGEVISAKETDEGLEVEIKLDLENPTALQAYKLVKGRRIKEYSFGFIANEVNFTTKDGMEVREVLDVELLEVSMTMIGANRATRTVEVRQAPDDNQETAVSEDSPASIDVAEKVISKLEEMASTIQELLSELTGESGTDEVTEPDKQATASGVTADEEPSEVKSAIDYNTAVANADSLSLFLKTIEIERMIQK